MCRNFSATERHKHRIHSQLVADGISGLTQSAWLSEAMRFASCTHFPR